MPFSTLTMAEIEECAYYCFLHAFLYTMDLSVGVDKVGFGFQIMC